MAPPTQDEIILSINNWFVAKKLCGNPVMDFGKLFFQTMKLVTETGKLGSDTQCEVYAVDNIYKGTKYAKARLPLPITYYKAATAIKIIGDFKAAVNVKTERSMMCQWQSTSSSN
ncbi:hypothetical protein H4R19_003541 [Coemansia spiralis]|nr:hypothetical protein H4R19_003541 [Coemansia spiralis]